MKGVITEGIKQMIPCNENLYAVYERGRIKKVLCLALDHYGEIIPIILHDSCFRNAYDIDGLIDIKRTSGALPELD